MWRVMVSGLKAALDHAPAKNRSVVADQIFFKVNSHN
jgi:hypothetical protein